MSPTALFILHHIKVIPMGTVLVRATVGYGQSEDKVNLFLVLFFKIIFKVISALPFALTHSNFTPLFFLVSSPFPFSLLFLLSQFIIFLLNYITTETGPISSSLKMLHKENGWTFLNLYNFILNKNFLQFSERIMFCFQF